MKRRIHVAIACSTAALSIAACGSAPARPAFDAQLARSVNDTATRAAVAKSGARVCRPMQVGIAERDWIRGVVTEILGRCDRRPHPGSGRFPKTLNGTALARGAVVQDSPAAWTLCRF
jgi:hypothetical protein